MMRVVDGPVARSTDPATSFEAGEDADARQASERVVLSILRDARQPLPDAKISDLHARASRYLGRRPAYTEQRLRTARAQLVRKGLVSDAGVREGASPSGRRAHVWEITPAGMGAIR